MNQHEKSHTDCYTCKLPKKIVQDKIFDFERRAWDSFCESHPIMSVAHSCLGNVSLFRFWLLPNQFPDFVIRLHVQMRLIDDFGLNRSIPWFQNTDGTIRFICREDIASVAHFFIGCSCFRDNFESFWSKLKLKIHGSSPTDRVYNYNFSQIQMDTTRLFCS